MGSVETDFVYGLLGLILFIFRNPQKKFLYWTSLFVLGLFISQLVHFSRNEIPGQVTWILSAIGLTTFYFLRIKDRGNFRVIDCLKILAIILLIVYPLPFYSLVNVGESIFWAVLRLTTFSIVGMILVYDRWILNPGTMKKKFIIVLIVQSVVILLMAMYAFIQKASADTAQRRAEDMRVQAEKNASEVVKLRRELENTR